MPGEQGTPNLQQEAQKAQKPEGQPNLRDRLTERARAFSGKVKEVVTRARGEAPRTALTDIAGASEQKQPLTEKEVQQGAKALVASIDRLFPEDTKQYGKEFDRSVVVKGTENNTVPTFRAESYHKGQASLDISQDADHPDTISFSEAKPVSGNGPREITLQRQYFDADGVRARDEVRLIVQEDKTVKLDFVSRKTEVESDNWVGSDKRLFGREFQPALGYTRKDFYEAGDSRTYGPADVLKTGQEIIGAATKAKTEQAAPPQQAPGK